MATTTQLISQGAQFLANIAQVFLVVGIYIGWKQLSTAVEDIKIRSKREAGILAITHANTFATEIIPLSDEINSKFGGSNTAPHKFEKFVPLEVRASNQQKYIELNEQMTKDSELSQKITILANKIDSLAMSFNKGLANEEIIFESIGPVYCQIIESLHFFYCRHRRSDGRNSRGILSYQNTINLYSNWKNRMDSIGFELEKEELDEKLKTAHTKGQPIKTLGA